MKITISSLLILFALLVYNSSNAQYRNRNGLDRRMMSGQGHNPSPKKQKPVDQVQASTEKLTTELNLDGFQSAVLKTIIEDYKNASSSIMEEQTSNELKYEKLKIANDKMETKILEILNDQQKSKFLELKKKAEKKDTKEKKKKNKNEEAEELEAPVEEK